MAATDDYITQVTDRIPLTSPLRARIALELRATIAERVERGQPPAAVLAQLGDPDAQDDGEARGRRPVVGRRRRGSFGARW